MGVYKLNAQELADAINKALDEMEGDFDMNELKKAFRLVSYEQKLKLVPPSIPGDYKRARGVLASR
jgi:uncharacterized protein YajQ (UPF0234 family)